MTVRYAAHSSTATEPSSNMGGSNLRVTRRIFLLEKKKSFALAVPSIIKIENWCNFGTSLTSALQYEAPYRGHLTSFLQTVYQSGCVNLIGSHASLQSLHGCKLNTVAWVVELTYLHVIVKCLKRKSTLL